jgi:heterotetrameric sarcosine oxidase gamma subunit
MPDTLLQARSPLGTDTHFRRDTVSISESPGFALTQVAGDEKALKKALGKLPGKPGWAIGGADGTLFRIGPRQIWLLDGTIEPATGIFITPLSSSRTRIMLEGAAAREVLAACAAIDFGSHAFQPGQFAMTGIHHTPVLIHCAGTNAFHVYAMRTFARAVWDWLVDVVEGLPG